MQGTSSLNQQKKNNINEENIVYSSKPKRENTLLKSFNTILVFLIFFMSK